MEIEYIRSFDNQRVKTNLNDIAKQHSYGYSGVAEIANANANSGINFTEKLVELLYEKGVLDKNDIAKLVSQLTLCDPVTVTIKP